MIVSDKLIKCVQVKQVQILTFNKLAAVNKLGLVTQNIIP